MTNNKTTEGGGGVKLCKKTLEAIWKATFLFVSIFWVKSATSIFGEWFSQKNFIFIFAFAHIQLNFNKFMLALKLVDTQELVHFPGDTQFSSSIRPKLHSLFSFFYPFWVNFSIQKEEKMSENSQKNICGCFRMCAAPSSRLKYTTQISISYLSVLWLLA